MLPWKLPTFGKFGCSAAVRRYHFLHLEAGGLSPINQNLDNITDHNDDFPGGGVGLLRVSCPL